MKAHWFSIGRYSNLGGLFDCRNLDNKATSPCERLPLPALTTPRPPIRCITRSRTPRFSPCFDSRATHVLFPLCHNICFCAIWVRIRSILSSSVGLAARVGRACCASLKRRFFALGTLPVEFSCSSINTSTADQTLPRFIAALILCDAVSKLGYSWWLLFIEI